MIFLRGASIFFSFFFFSNAAPSNLKREIEMKTKAKDELLGNGGKEQLQRRTNPFAMCSDADLASQTGPFRWESKCLTGFLEFGDESRKQLKIHWSLTKNYSTQLNVKGMGMQLSDLVKFRGDYLSPDDKTGLVYKLKADSAVPWVYLADGDGNNERQFKTEWLTVKDGNVYAGSIGTEFLGDQGEIENLNQMFVKKITPYGNVIHMNWTEKYVALREKIGIHPLGYVTHEAVRWSEIHKKWFFLPRQIAKTLGPPYRRDNKQGANLMMITSDCFCDIETINVGKPQATHGFSAFDFVPDTGDTLIMAIKTEEILSALRSYVMVFDITGKILIDETEIPMENQKFEGLSFLYANDKVFKVT
ncbi:unnamed protein product, partial [Mesorhabditis belari]|uniref:Apyrase n=1 Tax=Mesorhabditis belari TaxID=2138241 RepID=A0AAF3ENF7_9BILA